MISSFDNDNLEQLSEALLAFFDEVEADRQVCIRHAPTTDIHLRRTGELLVTKRYRCLGTPRDVELRLRAIEKAFPPKPRELRAQRGQGQRVLFCGEAYAPGHSVKVLVSEAGRVLTVRCADSYPGLPCMPMQRLAALLMLHETLVPMAGFEPIRVRRNGKKLWPVQAFLLRKSGRHGIPPASAFRDWPEA